MVKVSFSVQCCYATIMLFCPSASVEESEISCCVFVSHIFKSFRFFPQDSLKSRHSYIYRPNCTLIIRLLSVYVTSMSIFNLFVLSSAYEHHAIGAYTFYLSNIPRADNQHHIHHFVPRKFSSRYPTNHSLLVCCSRFYPPVGIDPCICFAFHSRERSGFAYRNILTTRPILKFRYGYVYSICCRFHFT